jgi:hypothetical protein
MPNIINLTPHLVILRKDGVDLSFPESGIVARLPNIISECADTSGIGPVTKLRIGKPTFLPEPVRDTMFIVSGMVLTSCPHRKDLIAPRTDKTAIRDKEGKIVAVTGWFIN